MRRRRGLPAASPPSPAPDLRRLLERLNPATLAQATGHKVILHRHLAALGLPVPRLHGVIGRAGGWSASADRPVLGEDATARFLGGLAGDIVVRPFAESHGAGLRVLRREGSELIDLDGRRCRPSAVAAEVAADPRSELFVVQERLTDHERVRALCSGDTLRSVRMTTFVSADGRAQVVHAYLRLLPATGGGVSVEIDTSTGALGPRPPAPVSAAWNEGDRLPDWSAACALVRRAAGLLMPQRTIAWDIALTPDGPVVVGADSRYERIDGARFDEALRAMERAIADEGPVASPGAA